ncbi:MAG: ribose-5-phosphate isomerase A [Betaproteobacteria bacterium]|jgi:ribose 5-phosphate isomerase A|nr:Ribose-5-phosphate isomerase A [Rhodocyclaceae bacterium]
MSADHYKRLAAEAALSFVEHDAPIGVGTGSTANHFIDLLATRGPRIAGAVASSQATADRLRAHGIELLDLNALDRLSIYVDGADEIDPSLNLVKGGGGALTREKIVAAVAERFVCIADDSKWVARLGRFPVPVEVIPMARAHVERAIARLGGRACWRTGFVTDNGNVILDVHELDCADPEATESALDQIVGVVSNGLFARRGADIALIAGAGGVERRVRSAATSVS